LEKNSLHYAAEYGAPDEIIKALISAGADPKAKDINGKTPADVARQNIHPATAAFIEQFIAPIKSANLAV
jgi:ankyrin repeat protein